MIGNNNILVTVIIPLYNAEKYISETIKSVINQTYQNWEMIVVDDCSTDSSRDIVKNFEDQDSRIKLIQSTVNFGGPALPRNIGIENAKGTYIAFLDADDVWMPHKIEEQLNFVVTNNINFTSSYCYLIDDNNSLLHLSKKSSLYYKTISKKSIQDVIKNSFIITSSVFIEKELLVKFNEEKNFIAVEDFDMWLRVLANKKAKYKYQEQKLLKYRVLDNSASDRNNLLAQELKANIVLANFIFANPQYIWSYFYRLFFHLFRKKLKSMLS